MSTIYVEKLNESDLRVTSDDHGIEYELNEFFSFPVPGARFMPSFRAKIWDGIARVYNIHTKVLPVGLVEYVRKFAADNEYKCEVQYEMPGQRDVTLEQVAEFVRTLDPHTGGRRILVRDYQLAAIHAAITRGRMIAKSPTSSGKSLIIYCYLRWQLARGERVLLLVPTTGLVSQMFSDFEDYSSANGWSAADNVHQLYGGAERTFDKPALVSTWQSVHSMGRKKDAETKKFFEGWTVYIGDECHLFTAASLQQISSKLVNAKCRLGTTGTVQDAKVQKLTLEGSFGAVMSVISTRELMDAGQVVQLKIKCLLLDYDKQSKTLLKGADFKKEIDFIVTNSARNKFVINVAKASTGNTLILFNFVEKQGKPLFELAQRLCPGRPMFYISGEVNATVREEIRKVLSTHDNAIVIASSATTATGVNIPSIENIILASPSKSRIRNLQSIGRGLRLKEGKTACNLIDIADNLALRSGANYAMLHFKERLETYQSEKFEFDVKQIAFNAG